MGKERAKTIGFQVLDSSEACLVVTDRASEMKPGRPGRLRGLVGLKMFQDMTGSQIRGG